MVANVKFNRLGEIGRAGGQDRRIITHLRERTLAKATVRPTLAAISDRVLTPILEGRAQVAKEVVSEALKMKIEMNKRMRQLPAQRPAAEPKKPVDDMSGRPTHIHQAAELLQSAAALAAATEPKPVAAPLPAPQPAPAPAEETKIADASAARISELEARIKNLEGQIKTQTESQRIALAHVTKKASQDVQTATKANASLRDEKTKLEKELAAANKAIQSAKEEAKKEIEKANNNAATKIASAATAAEAEKQRLQHQIEELQATAKKQEAALAAAQSPSIEGSLTALTGALSDPAALIAALQALPSAVSPEAARIAALLKIMISEKIG